LDKRLQLLIVEYRDEYYKFYIHYQNGFSIYDKDQVLIEKDLGIDDVKKKIDDYLVQIGEKL
jgi:hypothetical protein